MKLNFHSIYNTYIDSYKGLSTPVWILAIAMLINRSGMMVIPFMSLYLRQELGFSYYQVGNIMAFFGVGAAVGAYVGGTLVEKFGSRQIQLVSLVMTALAFFTLEVIKDYQLLCAAVFITAVISESFRPANMKALTEFSTPENRTRSISLVRLAINLGYSIGPAVGGFVTGLWGFSWIFWIDGTACLLAALYLSRALPHIKSKVSQSLDKSPETSSYLELLKNKWFVCFVLLNTISMTVFLQLMSTVPLFYREGLHLAEWQIGLLIGGNGFLIALFEMPIVYVAEQKYSHSNVIIFGVMMIGLSYFVFALSHSIIIVFLAMIFLSFGEILHMPFSSGLILKKVKESQIGRSMALYSISFSIAFILAPKGSMYIIENYSYDHLWYISFLLTIIASVGYYLLNKARFSKD